ncbi:S-layer homology domain-containing protein [Lysinibacillus sp. NPDC094403]|uniref:S-layer homology domain-containing protein n=1 Tax=Lysinibacillus sp. NPDC094403 TaxID=3390581 RepID=UPI003D06A658
MKNSALFYDKLFKTAMATAMATSAIAVVAPDATKASAKEAVFTDVKLISDYYEYVNELFERGFVSGYEDGSFKPTGLLTRAQASKILALNLGLDITKSFNHTFKDVPTTDWAYPYVAALKEAGIIDGYQDGTFKPNAPITRNQMAKIIVNGYGLKPATEINLPFTDTQVENNWAAPYIQTLFDLGITKGQTATTYGGNSTVTRANMAAFTIRSEITTDYRDNRRPDENVISAIEGNKITIDSQVYYIKKELQPLLNARNIAVLNEANLDFIKIGTKIVGIRNLELLNGGTAENPLTLDLAGGTVEANIMIAGDYIKLANANITGDITIKKGDQKQIELSGLELNGRLIIEGEAKRNQESVIKLTNTTADEIVVNRDKTKIWTDNSATTIKVGDNVSEIKPEGKINSIDFIGNQDVFVKGTLEANKLTVEAPVKVTLENKAQLPTVETKQYGSQLIVPTDSTIGTLIKPVNVKPEEAVKLPAGGIPTIGTITNTSEVVRPTTPPVTPPTTGSGSTGGSSGGGGNGGGVTNPFVSQTLSVNNVVDAPNTDPLAVGMIGTTTTTSNPNVATATLKDGKITITSKGPGTAVITVKEGAPSLNEAQILVTVDSYGKITQKIKRPLEVVQEKLKATPTPATEDLVKLYDAIDIKGITPTNVADVTAAVKKAIAEKGKPLTEEELKLTVDIALLPEKIKKENPSLQQVSTPLDLIAMGPNGTVFDWKSVTKVGSHNANIDLATGNVTRDDADNENDKVKLNVTAKNGSVSKDASIEATILEVKLPGQELTGPLSITSGTDITSAKILNEDGLLYLVNMADVKDIVDVKKGDLNTSTSEVYPNKELTQDVLNKLVKAGKAKKVEAINNVYATTPTDSLTSGIYRIIAVDKAGNLAIRFTTNIVELKEGAATDINSIADNLTADVIRNQNPSLDEVRTALNLPTSFGGATIEWSANAVDGATIAPEGTVTRSANDDKDDVVTLTATITFNGMTTTKTFQVTIKENKAPTIVRVETVDQDFNGKIDRLKITLSESIKDSTVDVKDFTISGYNNLGFETGDKEDNNEIYITFDEGAVYDTGQTPKLTYTKGTLSDLSGNVLATDSIESLDKANPILVAASISDDMWNTIGDILTLTYSETVEMDTNSEMFRDKYPDSDGLQIYFPAVDALIGLDTANFGGNALKNTFNIKTTQSNEGSRITADVAGDKIRLIIIHQDFISGGVPANAAFNIIDKTIDDIKDNSDNKLKHTVKKITVEQLSK